MTSTHELFCTIFFHFFYLFVVVGDRMNRHDRVLTVLMCTTLVCASVVVIKMTRLVFVHMDTSILELPTQTRQCIARVNVQGHWKCPEPLGTHCLPAKPINDTRIVIQDGHFQGHLKTVRDLRSFPTSVPLQCVTADNSLLTWNVDMHLHLDAALFVSAFRKRYPDPLSQSTAVI